jgi:septation ring formation regulator EzrA
MADRIDDLTERVQTVEEKLDRLSASVNQLSTSVDRRFDQVDARFAKVDERFDALDAAIVEQRQYTEFAYSRLEAKMDAGFGRVERKLDQFIDVQLQTNQLVDRRLRALEQQGRGPDA